MCKLPPLVNAEVLKKPQLVAGMTELVLDQIHLCVGPMCIVKTQYVHPTA